MIAAESIAAEVIEKKQPAEKKSIIYYQRCLENCWNTIVPKQAWNVVMEARESYPDELDFFVSEVKLSYRLQQHNHLPLLFQIWLQITDPKKFCVAILFCRWFYLLNNFECARDMVQRILTNASGGRRGKEKAFWLSIHFEFLFEQYAQIHYMLEKWINFFAEENKSNRVPFGYSFWHFRLALRTHSTMNGVKFWVNYGHSQRRSSLHVEMVAQSGNHGREMRNDLFLREVLPPSLFCCTTKTTMDCYLAHCRQRQFSSPAESTQLADLVQRGKSVSPVSLTYLFDAVFVESLFALKYYREAERYILAHMMDRRRNHFRQLARSS